MVRWLPLLLLFACGRSGEPTLLAAASLVDVVPEIYDGLDVRASFAASSTLARQIEHGMEADLFLSADEAWVEHLQGRGIGLERRAFALNQLVAWAPPDGPLSVAQLADPRWGRIAIGGEAVPVGRYARSALKGIDVADRLLPCRNARAVIAAVRAGEAGVGIAYATDGGGDLEIAFRLGDVAVTYWALVLSERGRGLLDRVLTSPDVLRKHGFAPLP